MRTTAKLSEEEQVRQRWAMFKDRNESEHALDDEPMHNHEHLRRLADGADGYSFDRRGRM